MIQLIKDKIKELSESKTQSEIAKELKISQSIVSYWLSSEDKRNLHRKRVVEYFRNLPLEKRRLVYKRRLPYLTKYQKERYTNDLVYREKMKSKSRKIK